MKKEGKILLTGSTGFIGKEILKVLLQSEYDVIGIDSKTDVTDKKFSSSNFLDVKHVIHSAGKVFVPDSWVDPVSFLEVNVNGTSNVLEYCRKNEIGCTFISGYVYGTYVDLPIRESANTKPMNPYAYSKLIAESVCKMYSDIFNIPVQIIRPFNVYGNSQSENFIIPKLVSQCKFSDKYSVLDLQPKRDYLHVNDLARMVEMCCFRKDSFILNAGTGISYSVQEIIDILQDLSGQKKEIISNENTRKNEIQDCYADISMAKKILNWKPEMDFRSGLNELLK
jgi:GDP-4-dehydro-6-deoxy-D-mannose reductase